MLRMIYVLFAVLVLGAYALVAFRGLELTRPRKTFAPQGQSMRGAQGGGSRTFWYGGYRGGK